MEEKQKSRGDERMWSILLSEIEKGNVVPIIGNELFCIHINDECIHLNEYIIRKITDALNIEYDSSLTFTELESSDYSREWKKLRSDIYFETCAILKEMEKMKIQSSDVLKKLLNIDKFKTIISTSFDNSTLKTMEEKWGKGNVKELSYIKNSAGQDIEDLSRPLLYHLFGKASSGTPHSFVLTEEDLLDFLHNWMNDGYHPKRLANVLRDKYLLVIGCNYPNWLFRFFIHSIKHPFSKDKIGVIADSYLDKNLLAFLSRIEVDKYENVIEFIDKLVERWNNRPIDTDKETRDVFISYASEDREVAGQIAKIFEEKGATVWFDVKELDGGDDYEQKIEKHIQECRAFVPILSRHSFVQNDRYFRLEWDWAIKRHKMLPSNKKFIYPIKTENIDVSNKALPKEFRNKHIIDKSKDTFEEEIKKIVQDTHTN